MLNRIRTNLGTSVKPIYLQEPKPFDGGCFNKTDTESNMSVAAIAVANAKVNGAAAWTFHNRASFNLAGPTTTLKSALTSAGELGAVEGLFTASGAFWGATVFTGSNNPTVPASAGNSSISLTRMADTSPTGNWKVLSNSASWVHPIAPSGSGDSVAFNYESNPTSLTRVATLNISGLTVTVTQQPRVIFDFDGDRKSDHSIFRPSTGVWYIRKSSNSLTDLLQWGLPQDVPVAADYDGDSKTDIAVYRPTEGNWYVRRLSDQLTNLTQWGLPGDEPAPGDYDRDGKSDHAVFRPSNGTVVHSPIEHRRARNS